MVAMMHMLKNLSVREKEAIMEVLSRDRRLRESEEERVMRLRIELARERRAGFVLSQHGKSLQKRTCARCRESVGFIGQARCPICNHIICKNCRVTRQTTVKQPFENGKSIANASSTINNIDLRVGTHQSRMTKNRGLSGRIQSATTSPVLPSTTPRIARVRFSESVSDPEDRSFGKSRMHKLTSTPVKAIDMTQHFLKSQTESTELRTNGQTQMSRTDEQKVTMYCQTSSERSGNPDVDENYSQSSDDSFRDRIHTSDDDRSHESSFSNAYSANKTNQLTIPQITSARTSSSEFNETDAVTFLKEMGLNKTESKTQTHQGSGKDTDTDDVSKPEDSTLVAQSVSTVDNQRIIPTSQNQDQPPPIITIDKPKEIEPTSKPLDTSLKKPSQEITTQPTSNVTTANEFFSAVGKLFNVPLFKKTFFGLPLSITKLSPVEEVNDKVETTNKQSPTKLKDQPAADEANGNIISTVQANSNVAIPYSENVVEDELSQADEKVVQDYSSHVKNDGQLNLDGLSNLYDIATPSTASTPPTSESYSSEIPEPQAIAVSDQKYKHRPVTSEESRDEDSSTEMLIHPAVKTLQDNAIQRRSRVGKSLTQRHRNGEIGARKRVRKTLKQRMNARKTHLKCQASSSDGEASTQPIPTSPKEVHDNSTESSLDFKNTLQSQTRSHSISIIQREADAAKVSTDGSDLEAIGAGGQWRRSSINMGLFDRLKEKIRTKTDDVPWVCKVCAKSLDLNKKSGDWFYKTARSEVLEFKENLVQNKPHDVDNDLLQSPHRDENNKTTASDADSKPDSPIQRVGRARSHTIDTLVFPSHLTLDKPALGLEEQASLKRRRLRLSRKSVAEVLHGSLLIHIPGRFLKFFPFALLLTLDLSQ